MTKRKSKTTAEFKPPKRAQPRAKRQKNTEETNLQFADENQIQTPKSENNNSHNESCSEKLDELQSEQSTLQICQTTEIPVDSCSLEEKTSNDVERNGTNPPEVSYKIEQTVEIAIQTPNPNNSDKYTLSNPSNVDVTNDVELNDEKSEITSNSNQESQKVPDDSELPSDECQTERELPHEERKATEPKMGERLGSSDTITETSVDETGVQMTEDSADPLVKRKLRKRMGMCRLGERKRMLKGQLTSGNVLGGGQENETGQVINEESVMMIDDLKKDDEEEVGTAESEASGSFYPLEEIPVWQEQEQPDMQVQVQVESMTSKQEITHGTDNTISSHADPLEEIETECVERCTNETNVREDKPEMCADVTTEIGTELTVDLAEVCKESADVSPQDVVVIESPVEALKETTEASASTSNHFEELLEVGGNEMEVEECECDMNTSISGHTNEECVELTDITVNNTVSAPPAIEEIEDKCVSLDCTLVAVTGENSVNCEDRSMWSLSFPAALPCGEDKEVQLVTECDGVPSDAHKLNPSPAAEPDPCSPLSIFSVTDSQLNNIPLSLEDFPLSEDTCELEDATELVCGLIRDLAFLNQKVRDAHRRIGFQQGRNPPRPSFRCKYGPPH